MAEFKCSITEDKLNSDINQYAKNVNQMLMAYEKK